MDTLIIKMGSNSTTIFKEGEGVVLKEASLVAISGIGKQTEIKAVGNRAKYMQGRTGSDVEIVCPIFNGVINDNELATVMLKYFLDKIYGKKLIRPKANAIVCVPIGITEAEKKAFEKVCYSAKIVDIELVPSVFCSAVGLGLDVHTPRGTMVVNIGSSTTNISVMCLNSIVSGVCMCVGGKNIDVAIENEIRDKFNMKIADGVSEKIKIEIGSLYDNDNLRCEFEGQDNETKGTRTETLTSRDIAKVVKFYIDKVADGIASVLSSCSPELVGDIKKSKIYVVGASSKITGLEQYLKRKIQLDVDVIEQSEDIEMLGAEKLLQNPRQLETIIRNL